MDKRKEDSALLRGNLAMFILIILLTIALYFFLGVSFTLSTIERALLSAVMLTSFLFTYRRNTSLFWIFALTAITVFISLGISFSARTTTDSPIALDIVLGPWMIALLSYLIALLAAYSHEKMKSASKFPLIFFIVFLLNWIILAFNPSYLEGWMLENALTVPSVILVFIGYRWLRLSNISYGLIFVYLFLHIVGAHYTYAEVPFGDWLKNTFDLSRNHYDRVVHFSFGFLLAYPLRELVKRIGAAQGFWGLYLPIEFVLAFSAIFEMIEWQAAAIFGGDLGVAYLGTQGDEWDAIKDMALAGLGALITMVITLLIILCYNARDFWIEFKDSLSVKDKNPLGERVIQEWAARKKKSL